MNAPQLRDLGLDLTQPEARARVAELKAAVIRLRNFGGSMDLIADKLKISVRDAEALLTMGVRDIMADDVETIVARQQAVLNDMTRALYPAMAAGDTVAAQTLIRAMDHSAKLHGAYKPQRVRVGLDADEFAATVADDMQALGIGPVIDVEPEEDTEPWADI